MKAINDPGFPRGSNPGPVPDAYWYHPRLPPGNLSNPVTNEGLDDNQIEVSTGRINLQKLFQRLIFVSCVLVLLILGIYLGLKHSGENETPKQCLPGHYKFPYCIKCECTSDGTTSDCDDNGDCICKHGFDGSKCDKCKEGFTGSQCDKCKPNIMGHKCNECKPTFFNYPLCQDCVCNSNGSTSLECGKNNGQCFCQVGFAGVKCQECRPFVIGDKCDKCEPGFYDYPSCHEGGTKMLITTGESSNDGRNTEIIDVEDSSFSCPQIKQFPVKLYGAIGGLMTGQVPFICGGGAYINNAWTPSKDCYQLNQAGSWAKDPKASLDTARGYAGCGSVAVILHNQLILTGGFGDSFLDSIEMVSPNKSTTSSNLFLPAGFNRHCQVKWDDDTFMVIGGYPPIKDETLFVNVKTNQLTNGPSLKVGRSDHACGEIKVNGKSFIVVSGGLNGQNGLRSTEVLDKNNLEEGWKKRDDFDLPFDKYNFQMVSPPDKKALYAIGGHKFNQGDLKNIYKFSCTGGINTCKWTKSDTTLGFRHYEFVAIPIPLTLTNKLCN